MKGGHIKFNEASGNARDTLESTVFDCLHDLMPSTSAGTRYARPGRSAKGPAFTDDVTHYDHLYVRKCMDAVCVYFAGESKNTSAKELLKFEAVVFRIPRIPTQHLF